ncbi:alkaline phosphatase family protein [Telmatospirillum sp.]|uniref:alkaline phosphatase family protein n=1 Tax=Telmatospirillum sp. TaxID=2079197 RepID=UPI00284FFADB|nr:alkaline phosphatase family protein [Telmatospirillum sp.]MDR3441285.1 alkaline phosphatase family protein [Telmatospirillum sp.]
MALADIDHIVVLMLENRSFDCLLGKLYPPSDRFAGLTGAEQNPDPSGVPIPVWNAPGTDDATMSIPDPDPGELFTDINMQLFGTSTPPVPTPVPTMSGFVRNYLMQGDGAGATSRADAVMHYFTPEQVPVISELARQFAVCDHWYASAPCQTWPNRFFVHTATANGYENNSPPHFPYDMETIFNRLDGAGQPWKIYFHDIPQSLTLSKLWLLADHFRFYDEFRHDAKTGELPAYSFIEPRYFSDVSLPNDQHPPHVVTLGEQLTADVYNCLRSGPNWARTLLVITYDEHGGCYDHVPPPPAVPPGPGPTVPFNFDRYGVRVPAVIVSPFVPAGSILRAPPGSAPYDHTSIIATLRTRFGLGGPLTNRDKGAPDLAAILTLPEPTNVGPLSVTPLSYAASPAEVAAAQAEPLNNQQRGLAELAAHLPATTVTGDFPAFISSHLDLLGAGGIGSEAADAAQDVASAVSLIRSRLGNLFRGL